MEIKSRHIGGDVMGKLRILVSEAISIASRQLIIYSCFLLLQFFFLHAIQSLHFFKNATLK